MNKLKAFSILALLLASMMTLPAEAASCSGTGKVMRVFRYVPSKDYTPVAVTGSRLLYIRASQLYGLPYVGVNIKWSGGTTTNGGASCSLLAPPAKLVVLGP